MRRRSPRFTQDAAGLRAYWNRLSDADRLQPRVARAAARGFMRPGERSRSRRYPRAKLDRNWDSELVALYAECTTADATRQLETAERWLTQHNHDATLLFALGRLCERAQLWGKAQTYLEASLALDARWRTHLALGELHGRLGQFRTRPTATSPPR